MTRFVNALIAAMLAAAVTAFSPSMKQDRHNLGLKAATLDGQDIRGDITPLGNFVLVRTKDTLAATGGGILLPDQVSLLFMVLEICVSLPSLCISNLCLYLSPPEPRKTNGRISNVCRTRKASPTHWSSYTQSCERRDVSIVWKIRRNTLDLQR